MIKIILFSLWYLFMITLSFNGMGKLHIGFDKWWYGTKYCEPDHNLRYCMGGFFGSIIWPLTWLIIVMSKGSKFIIDKIEQEQKEKNNERL